ncbi:MAG: VWA domain-containing protein, partial [Candidatus Pacebacteria bacterium]|nr:VWA domain-containing protein [Candidatus Paceibacterota bacterium]
MLSWSSRRRLLYTIGVVLPIVIIILIVLFVFWYERPSCFDGKQNGDELGVDCGGSCELLCKSEALDVEVLWSRAFEVLPFVYNLVAYVENPNIHSGVDYAPYEFTAYDEDNNVITTRRGVTTIPDRDSFVVFEGTVRTGEEKIARTLFTFTKELDWKKVGESGIDIDVTNTVLVGTESFPRITATLINNSLVDLSEVEVPVVIFDSEGNAINASRTIVEKFLRETQRNIVFTWPEPFALKEEVCTNPTDISLIIDRSGSMNDDGNNPPEPLTSVKVAAKDFVKNLMSEDSVSVVSFATEASLDLPQGIFGTTSSIDNISIGPDENNQHTNIYQGLKVSFDEISRYRDEVPDVIVLLTDGIATRPLDAGNENFAEEISLEFAKTVKGSGTGIYVIGLGN